MPRSKRSLSFSRRSDRNSSRSSSTTPRRIVTTIQRWPALCDFHQPKNDTPRKTSTGYRRNRKDSGHLSAVDVAIVERCEVRHLVACQAATVALMLDAMLRGPRQPYFLIDGHGPRDDVGSTSARHAAASRDPHPRGSRRARRLRIAGFGRRRGQATGHAAGDGCPAAPTAGYRSAAAAGPQADTAGREDRSESHHRIERGRRRGMVGRADGAKGRTTRDDLALHPPRLRSRHLFLP
jgi:hypothetical protein